MITINFIAIFILVVCLLSPDIVFMIHRKHFIWKNTSEHGYSTPKQYRYSKNDTVIFIENGVEYLIVETGRYDYLIIRKDGEGDQRIVLQSEIKLA